MNTTQQPEALSLEEFRAKVTHAAREPLLARIAELEAQLSAICAGGVEPLRKQASTADVVVADERDAFEKWLRIKPCGAAHDFGWEAWKARDSLAATPAAGELATLQAGLQAAAPNAPLYDPREVAFSAQPAVQGLDAETRRHAAIGKAIERACADLPEETEIIVSLEKDAGTVTLIDQDGNEHENFSTDYGFAGVLNEAIDTAIAAQAKQGEKK